MTQVPIQDNQLKLKQNLQNTQGQLNKKVQWKLEKLLDKEIKVKQVVSKKHPMGLIELENLPIKSQIQLIKKPLENK